jgi:glyoxylase-like metal-dependent hydrolase (beta-lactamase superfamily II)
MLYLSLLIACADITPIEDGRTLGPVITMKDWFTSATLLPTEAGPVVFDAGYREGNMERALEANGVSPDEVIAVLVTHGHTDHLGAAAIYTGAQFYAQAAEQSTIEAETEGAVTIDVQIEGGDLLTFGEHTIEVFSVPGHTPGSTVYLTGGVLIMGDTALITGSGSLEPVDKDRSEDPAEAAASLRELAEKLAPREEEVDWLVPSHSGAAKGLGALLDYADL